MNFDQAFEVLIGHEGGFTDDPHDRGNWTTGIVGHGNLKGTKYGISAMSFPHLDIRNLTLDQAKSIYKRKYWHECHCDELPKNVRFRVFDVAVNSGVRTAIKLLQRAAKAKPDGWYGPNTRAAIKRMNPYQLSERLSGFRLMMVASLSSFRRYGRGWSRRIAKNLIGGV